MNEREAQSETREMGFLDGVFSFLFGDGFPGPSEAERWSHLATFIRQQAGVVTAEQLLPLLHPLPALADVQKGGCGGDVDVGKLAASSGAQHSVMSVLARFGGKPVAVKLGAEDKVDALIYDFPRLRDAISTGADDPEAGGDATDAWVPAALEEEAWCFSQASDSQQTWALGLGAINFLGAMWLRRQAAIFGALPAKASPLLRMLPLALSISWVLQAYATLFLLIPAFRYCFILSANGQISNRNAQRRGVAEAAKVAVADSHSALNAKLAAGRAYLAAVAELV